MKRYPAYKDSGVEWIGEVPEHWKNKRLKHCLELITDKETEDSSTKIALENIESWTGRYLETSTEFAGDGIAFKQNDILFGKLRPYLAKVWLAEFSGNAVGDIFVYRATKTVLPRFAFYRFISRDFIDIVNGSTFGAKMPRASSEFIGDLAFVYPPLSEQRAIAAYLDRKTAQIDTLIANKRRRVELLTEERTALISHAVTKGLDPDVPLKESGVEWIGEIPVGWAVRKIKHLSEITLGKMLTTEDKGGYFLRPYLRAKNLNWLSVDISDIKNMWFSERELNLYRLKKGDLLVSEGGEVGRTCIWDDELDECYIQNSVNRVRLQNGNYPRYFLYQFFSAGQRGHFEEVVNQVSIAHLTKEKLTEVIFAVPPLPEQRAIAAYLDEKTAHIDRAIAHAEQQIALLEEYRTALISAAVTGKIDVREGRTGG